MRRAAMALLLVVLAGCGSFDAAGWRRAAAAGDEDAMESQARRAVADDALLGLGPRALRRTLGVPERRFRGGTVWVWSVGMVGDAIGPGDAASLYVTLDGKRRRVVGARVDQAY